MFLMSPFLKDPKYLLWYSISVTPISALIEEDSQKFAVSRDRSTQLSKNKLNSLLFKSVH